jgi:putative membrane protein
MNEQVKLAKARTDLANQRTLLAYMRTGLAFFVAAVGLPKLYSGVLVTVVSVLLGLIGLFFVMAGLQVYRTHRVRPRRRSNAPR